MIPNVQEFFYSEERTGDVFYSIGSVISLFFLTMIRIIVNSDVRYTRV